MCVCVCVCWLGSFTLPPRLPAPSHCAAFVLFLLFACCVVQLTALQKLHPARKLVLVGFGVGVKVGGFGLVQAVGQWGSGEGNDCTFYASVVFVCAVALI